MIASTQSSSASAYAPSLSRAIARFEKTIARHRLDPRNVKAHLRRGAARAVSGNYLEALEDFESALRLEPRNRDARAEVSRMKNILGEANPIPDFD